VVLPENWSQWPAAQLDAVLAHEHEHARRRDPLFQWLALLNRAVFWFHPLAWWLERRIAALAEEACDAVVLARGHDPRDYSEYLIDITRVQISGLTNFPTLKTLSTAQF
jgi:beta-lactamase regulating signal transducer with metallopeptidase domain